MKILFSGGGTLGSVTPLLAMRDMIATDVPDTEFLWVGTKTGPEKELVERANIHFVFIAAAKWRRYLSIQNFFAPFIFVRGFLQALGYLYRQKPDVCISAGGFVSVPVHFAACALGIPTWIHQQDVITSMSNRLMAPCARLVTTALAESLSQFPKKKTRHIGNPVRQSVLGGNVHEARQRFYLEATTPVLLVVGGGTGALRLNEIMFDALPALQHTCQIIHVTGKDRGFAEAETLAKQYTTYHPYAFLFDDMKHAYAVADVVVMRGGFGTWSELAAIGKPIIAVPKPGHQVDNISFFKSKNAAIMFDEQRDGAAFAEEVKKLLGDTEKQTQLTRSLQTVLPRTTAAQVIDALTTILPSRMSSPGNPY